MKTIDEAVKEIYSYNVDEFTWISDEKRDAFITGVEFAQRWIPVEEELPEERVPVNVMLNYKFYGTNIQAVDVCKLVGSDWINCLRTQHSNGGVTHWRPIELK